MPHFPVVKQIESVPHPSIHHPSTQASLCSSSEFCACFMVPKNTVTYYHRIDPAKLYKPKSSIIIQCLSFVQVTWRHSMTRRERSNLGYKLSLSLLEFFSRPADTAENGCLPNIKCNVKYLTWSHGRCADKGTLSKCIICIWKAKQHAFSICCNKCMNTLHLRVIKIIQHILLLHICNCGNLINLSAQKKTKTTGVRLDMLQSHIRAHYLPGSIPQRSRWAFVKHEQQHWDPNSLYAGSKTKSIYTRS